MIDQRLFCDVKGKNIAILGLGVSNLPLVRMLINEGECSSITVYDKKGIEEMGAEALSLEALGVKFVSGFDNVCGDVIFRSPGFRPDRAELA
ncbi:MAG: UDP-N-acetylmuramoyl-L-alanine--D-glutamate ligase, partial [Ruminococcaceae bacterium]|nr:UDP-N-acetylmuramoyl-L-alanine--D-glutamate ligase [Oscillospiraceae bacterium]